VKLLHVPAFWRERGDNGREVRFGDVKDCGICGLNWSLDKVGCLTISEMLQ
jgi:hypothetical protein